MTSPTPLVLHVIPTAVARGAQREARALADRLDVAGRRRHRVLVLFAGPREVPAEHSLDHPGGVRIATGFDPRLVIRLRRELIRLDPVVVVAHGGDPLKYLVPAMVCRRRPLAYYATGTFAGSRRRGQLSLWRALVGRTDVVACEGREVMSECASLLRVPDHRLVLAPNGRDPTKFHPPTVGRAIDPNRVPVVSFVGAFNPGKGPGRFIEVVSGLRRRGLVFDALACGDGPQLAELTAPSARAGVELLGSRDDVDSILRRSDLMVFPSRPTGEGMPGVLIEAGLSGVPVVATEVPGVRWIVEDEKSGVVVPVDDVAAMENAVARLIEDPPLRVSMGSAARRRCEELFSMDAVVECWKGFLDPLFERGLNLRAGRTSRDARHGPSV